MKEHTRQRKEQEKLERKAEKSTSIASVIASVNKRKEWKNPLRPQDPMCRNIQWKLREGKRLTIREMSHMNNCDSCCLAYKEYGYLNSGLGLKSFWQLLSRKYEFFIFVENLAKFIKKVKHT